jgi:hypothetical protein
MTFRLCVDCLDRRVNSPDGDIDEGDMFIIVAGEECADARHHCCDDDCPSSGCPR